MMSGYENSSASPLRSRSPSPLASVVPRRRRSWDGSSTIPRCTYSTQSDYSTVDAVSGSPPPEPGRPPRNSTLDPAGLFLGPSSLKDAAHDSPAIPRLASPTPSGSGSQWSGTSTHRDATSTQFPRSSSPEPADYHKGKGTGQTQSRQRAPGSTGQSFYSQAGSQFGASVGRSSAHAERGQRDLPNPRGQRDPPNPRWDGYPVSVPHRPSPQHPGSTLAQSFVSNHFGTSVAAKNLHEAHGYPPSNLPETAQSGQSSATWPGRPTEVQPNAGSSGHYPRPSGRTIQPTGPIQRASRQDGLLDPRWAERSDRIRPDPSRPHHSAPGSLPERGSLGPRHRRHSAGLSAATAATNTDATLRSIYGRAKTLLREDQKRKTSKTEDYLVDIMARTTRDHRDELFRQFTLWEPVGQRSRRLSVWQSAEARHRQFLNDQTFDEGKSEVNSWETRSDQITQALLPYTATFSAGRR